MRGGNAIMNPDESSGALGSAAIDTSSSCCWPVQSNIRVRAYAQDTAASQDGDMLHAPFVADGLISIERSRRRR